jgi:dTDP-4-dehydrorhamnose reductase
VINKALKPKLLITGGTGVLGAALVKELSCIYDCVPLGKNSTPNNGDRADLTDQKECINILNKFCPDIIIHAAALTDVDGCEKKPINAFQINVQSTRYIVDWVLKQNNNIKLIYISTDSVYDDCESGCNEDKTLPGNVYSLTKLWAEDIVSKVEDSLILRTNFYTAHGERGIVDWLTKSIDQNSTLTLFTDIKFNPLYLKHLTNLILKCLSTNSRGVFNLGASGGGISKAEFIKLVIRYFSLNDVKYTYGRSFEANFMIAKRPHNMIMSIVNFEQEFGFSPPSVIDGINAMYKDCERNKSI